MFRFLVLLLVLTGVARPQAWMLSPGKAYGPVQLGQVVSQADQSLGPPSQNRPSSDSATSLRTYKDVALLVNQEQKIIGITVWNAKARTSGGLGVGSSLQDVRSALGPGLLRGPKQFAYGTLGIAFVYDDRDRVDRVVLFNPEEASPLQGDRLVVAGQRCGDLKLGMPLSQVIAAWGQPSGQTAKEYRWHDQRVGLLVEQGRIVAITLTSGDYITASGLKVGCHRAEVLQILGRPSQTTGGNLLYPERGIAFYLAGDLVSTVQVFSPQR